MCSKIVGTDPRSETGASAGGSLSLRMTAWYAGSAFVLVLLATSFLYWSFGQRISGQEDRSLAALAQIIRPLASEHDNAALRRVISAPGAAANEDAVWFRIVGADGRIMLQSPGNALPLARTTDRHIRTDRPRFQTVVSEGQTFRALAESLPGGETLQIAIANAASQALLLRYRESLTLVVALSIILCAGLGYLIARAGMRPLERIAEAAERIRVSTLHERLDTLGLPAELAALANTFNLMLDRLEQSFLQLSQFSADLAHELRTPISNMRGELEVALARPRSGEAYREVLGSALEECTRITRIIQSLLFLARAEMTGQPPEREALDLAYQVSTVLEFYHPMATESGLVLKAHVPEGLIIHFDRILLQQALGNLIANALAHTERGGRIMIEAERTQQQVIILIRDTGHGIAPQHLPHVFGRFYRADPARAHGRGNLGLGLAVVRAIMDLHGGRVTIESRPRAGTTVCLLVPAPGLTHPSN